MPMNTVKDQAGNDGPSSMYQFVVEVGTVPALPTEGRVAGSPHIDECAFRIVFD